MAHKLGAYHHLPHGIANALLITDIMRFNAAEVPAKMGTFSQYQYPHCKERYVECADFLHIKGKNDDEKFENLIAAIEELKEKVGIKKTIKDYVVRTKITMAQFCVFWHRIKSCEQFVFYRTIKSFNVINLSY